MMRVLSIISLPGPEAIHIAVRLLHVDVYRSQGSPVSIQRAPFVLGDTSPKFDCPNAAMKGPFEFHIEMDIRLAISSK